MFTTAIIDLVFRRPRLLKTFRGHSGAVISIALSPNGNLMASGGVDGVKIWDLKAKKEINIPQQAIHEKGQVSCVCWVTRRNEAFDTLCYGNALGFLVFLQHRPTEDRFEPVHACRIARGGEVLSLAADMSGPDATRIAVGSRDKSVQVYDFDASSRTLLPVISREYGQDKNILPKALAFDINRERDLFVFGLYDGGLYKYAGNNANNLAKYQLGSSIGNAAVDAERKLCIVDNTGNGFDMYQMETGHFIRTFPTREPKRRFPKGVAFADRSYAVVGGSDHGKVYIFARKTGEVLKILTHSKKGGVETIAAHDNDDGTVTIATASSTASGAGPIRLWKWTPGESSGVRFDNADDRRWTVMGGLEFIIKAIILLAAAAYLIGLLNEQYGGRLGYQRSSEDTKTPVVMHAEYDLHKIIQQAILVEKGLAEGRTNVKIESHPVGKVSRETDRAKARSGTCPPKNGGLEDLN